MNIDFTKIDKSKFECLQLSTENKGAVYFGQIIYQHSVTKELRKDLIVQVVKTPVEEVVVKKPVAQGGKTPVTAQKDKDKEKEKEKDAHKDETVEGSMDEEEKAKYNKLRHGVGIQLYGKTENGITCKYAGEWYLDDQTGDGHSIFPDGSEYRGFQVKGVFHGQGMYWWPQEKGSKQRNYYKGAWVDGKMHGQGEFKHKDGHSIKGTFVNNLYVSSQKGKKFFLNPLESLQEHEKYIKNSINSKKFNNEQILLEKQKTRLLKVESIEQLQNALLDSKQNDRTPLIISSKESGITSDHLLNILDNDGQNRNIQQLFLREITLKAQQYSYDQRPDFVSQQLGLNDNFICKFITGEENGQIMLYIDEFQGSDSAEVDAIQAKQWKYLYDPDYDLLFNNKVFPIELLQGKLIGEYIIHQLQLFDINLKPENIAFSQSGGGGMGDSHTIQLHSNNKNKAKNSQRTISRTHSGIGSFNLGSGNQAHGTSQDINDHNQSLQFNAVEKFSASSPRSNLTEQNILKKQITRLNEMKQEALSKMLGLEHFLFFMWSKQKYSHHLSDQKILDNFIHRFKDSLPLKYIDLVFVTNLN